MPLPYTSSELNVRGTLIVSSPIWLRANAPVPSTSERYTQSVEIGPTSISTSIWSPVAEIKRTP